MFKKYVKIEFTSGLAGEAYQIQTQVTEVVQVISSVTTYADVDGKPIELPDAVEYHIVDNDPPTPGWDI